MSRNRSALALALILVLAVVVVTGCAKKNPAVTTDADTSSSAAASTGSDTSDSGSEPMSTATGPVTTPVAGSELRMALMDAARLKLDSSSEYVVYQLFSQDDYAIGDIEDITSGNRQFVAWKGPKWKAVWVAPFGSATATAIGAKAALPDFSEPLLGGVDWAYKKPVTNAAMESSLSKAAVKWSQKLMAGAGSPYRVTLVKTAKDGKGVWWGRAVVQPADDITNSYESIEFWAKYSGGAWTGKAQDPEPPAPGTYFPASVVGTLGF